MNNDSIQSEEDWEELKENVDRKDLLLRQTFALEQILAELQQLNGVSQSDDSDEYQCEQCGAVCTETDLERHAKSCFNWMESMGNIQKHFREIS